MSGGTVKFVADVAQFNAPLAEASKSALNVAASAEEARQRIVSAYQQQVKAAQEVGASQSQLAAITSRAASQIASVTEDNARRQINALDRVLEKNRQVAAARATLAAATTVQPASSFSFGGFAGETKEAEALASAVGHVNSAHSNGVTAGVQFGSVIRGMEGNFSRNIRAAEAFGSTLSFLTPVVEAAFPIVGAATLGYALFEMGKHAYEAWENIVNLKSAIEGLNQLQIKVDADHGKALDSQEAAVESILAKTQGQSASLTQKYSYQSQKGIDLSDYFYSDQFKKLPDDVKGTFEQTYKNVAPQDAQARIASITKTIQELQSAIAGVKDGSVGAFLPVINGKGPSSSRDPLAYYQSQLTAAQQIRGGLTDANDTRTANLQSTQTDIGAAQAEEAKKAATAAREAEAKAAELRRKQAADMMVGLEADANVAKQWRDYAVRNSQIINEDMNERFKTGGLSEDDTRQLNQSGADQAARITAMRQGLDLTKQNTDALALASLQMAVATGQMSKLDAARVNATMHTQQYTDAMQKLKDQADSIATDHRYDQREAARQAALQGNQSQQDSLNANRQIQVMQDSQLSSPASSSAAAGFNDAIDSFVTASRDAAAQMRELTTNTLQGLNQQIVAAMSGQRTDFAGFGAGVFRSVSSTALQKGEGSIMSALGLGSGGKQGTPGNPLYVKIADGIAGAVGSVGKGAGGIFGSILGAFGLGKGGGGGSSSSSDGGWGDTAWDDIPAFANGGQITGPSLVGEKGPEIFAPSGTGTIIPNNRLTSGGGGHVFNIDATGSTDPAQVEAAVQRGIRAATPQIQAGAIMAMNERQLRRPSTSR